MLARRVLLLLAGVMAALVLAEGGLLAARYWRDRTLLTENTYDAEIGWVPTPDYHPRDRQVRDLVGVSRLRRYATNGVGARLWGTRPGRTRVLVVGDSFTQASDVSNDETYAHHFALATGLDTYAIGASGYGTLQEKKLLERLLAGAGPRPDVLVLQFCGNDFMDNSLELEPDSITFTQRIRPYRDPGRGDVYTLGRRAWFVLPLRASALVRFGLVAAQNSLHRHYGGYAVRRGSSPAQAAAYARAAAVTGVLLAELRALVPAARAYAFNCHEDLWDGFDQSAAFEAAARAAGFTPLMGARPYIDASAPDPRTLMAADGGHLNPDGHRALARFLAERLCAQERCG